MVGTGWAMRPKARAPASSRSISTGTVPAPVSSSMTPRCSGCARIHAVPSTGWPANRISASGLKIADTRSPARLRGKHERGLREADLLRERLHELALDLAGIREHGELVPSERGVREDVHDDVAQRRHDGPP